MLTDRVRDPQGRPCAMAPSTTTKRLYPALGGAGAVLAGALAYIASATRTVPASSSRRVRSTPSPGSTARAAAASG